MSSYWVRRPRKNKYGNIKVTIDGHKFDSKAEANRYLELKLMEDQGIIFDLQRQVPFVLQASFKDMHGKKQSAIKYVADFTYYGMDGQMIIEDVKSPATRKDKVYRLKKKMMAYKGYEITEV